MKKQALKRVLVLLVCIAAMPVLFAHGGQMVAENIEPSCLVEAEASYSKADGDSYDLYEDAEFYKLTIQICCHDNVI